LSPSSARNFSLVVSAVCVSRNSVSRRISRSNSIVEGSITHGRENQPRLRFAQRLVGHEVHASPEQIFQQLMQRKEVIVCALIVLKFYVNVHVAVGAGLAPGKGPNETYSSRSELADLLNTTLDNDQRIYHVAQLMPARKHFQAGSARSACLLRRSDCAVEPPRQAGGLGVGVIKVSSARSGVGEDWR